MKNLISFLTLLIFMLSITDDVINTEAKEGLSDPVLDTEGEELRAGYRYIIQSVFRPGGGISAYPLPNETCVYAVVQEVFGFGFPVIFRPAGSKMGDVIPESTDLNIMFPEGIVCGPSTVWKVDEFDESEKKYFVMTGGVAGIPGNETVSNWFKIEKVTDREYKFVFCPKVCESCITMCSDVGNFNWRLALSDSPLLVMFEKLLVGHNRY